MDSHQIIRLVLDSIPVGIYWKDRQLNYLGCNQAFALNARLSSPEELIGKSDFDMPWGQQAERCRDNDIQIIESGQSKMSYEERSEEDGKTTWKRITKIPLMDADGNFSGILGTYEDITEQKQKDKEKARLLRQKQQLEEEIRFRAKKEALILHAKKEWERTADAMPDLIFIVDLEHRFVRMNKTMLDRLGMTFQKALGSQCCFHAHGLNNAIANCPHVQALKDQQQYTIEVYEPRFGGYFELTVVPHYDAEGNLAGSVHIARDINDRKKAQQDQEKLHARLLHTQKLESVCQLAAGMAHEINTPAQFINTNIDFIDQAFKESSQAINTLLELLESVKDGTVTEAQINANITVVEQLDWDYLREEIPEAIRQSREGIQRVTNIIQTMKEFSHPGSGQKINSDLNRIIETTITVARNEWKYVATVATNLDPLLQCVPCLADDMGQVILSLIVNAAQAIEDNLGINPEGKLGKITISTRQYDHHVEIRISDTGSGIPKHIQNKVFDPFFTTKEIGKGTGQGLAIAHDVIVGKHGGTLVFETEPGSGTTFIIRLPTDT